MLRLCSDSSRSFTPQGGTEKSPGRSALHALIFFCNNSRAGPTGIPRSRHHRLLPTVMRHKQRAAPAKETSLRLSR